MVKKVEIAKKSQAAVKIAEKAPSVKAEKFNKCIKKNQRDKRTVEPPIDVEDSSEEEEEQENDNYGA